MNEKTLARYVQGIQKAVKAMLVAPPEARLGLLIEKSEPVVAECEGELRKEGITYPTNNETLATSRAIIWSAWISWLWTAKSERQNADENAKRVRPIVEKTLAWAIETGRVIGKDGRTPDDFLKQTT